MAGHPHPKRKLIRRLLLHGICLFEDEIKPPSAKHCSNGVAVKATNEVYCLTPHLFSQSLTAQRICAISSDTDKNSSHSFAKLSAW